MGLALLSLMNDSLDSWHHRIKELHDDLPKVLNWTFKFDFDHLHQNNDFRDYRAINPYLL